MAISVYGLTIWLSRRMVKIIFMVTKLVRCILSFNFGIRSSISEVGNVLGRYNLAYLFLFKT